MTVRVDGTASQPARRSLVILVERASQLPACHDAKVIALTPQAQYSLERAGIPHSLASEYEDEGVLRRANERADHCVKTFSIWIDQLLRSERIVADFRPAASHYYFLKSLFDAVILRQEVLTAIVRAEVPREIWYWESRHIASLSPSLYFAEGESIYSLLVPHLFADSGVERLRPLPPSDEQRPAEAACWSGLRAAYRQAGPLAEALQLSRKLVANLKRRSTSGTIVTLDRHLFLDTIRTVGPAVLYWDPDRGQAGTWPPLRWTKLGRDHLAPNLEPDRRSPTLEGAWDRDVQSDTHLRECKTTAGPAWAILASRLRFFTSQVVPEACRSYVEASHVFSALRPSLLLASFLNSAARGAVAQAARANGVPVVIIQHGAYGYFEWPTVQHTDLTGDHLIVWGSGVREYCLRQPGARTNIEVVGSLKLERIVSQHRRMGNNRARIRRALGFSDEGPVVIYCLTNLLGNARYISPHLTSDLNYFKIQRAIVDIFRDYPTVRFVVKTHPSPQCPESPIVNYVADKGITNCQFVKERPFSELLALGDLFIIDSPTTTLLEVLAARKKVLVLNEFFRWEPGALELLKKATVYSSDMQGFLDLLRAALTFEWSVPSDPDSLLQPFGLAAGTRSRLQVLLAALSESRGRAAAVCSRGPHASEPYGQSQGDSHE